MAPQTTLIIESWPIDRPKPYPKNARKISGKAVEKVAQSLRQFGWRQPIVVDRDGVIVVGHARLLAAKRLNMTTVPVHVASDLTPAQIRAYRLADNRLNEETTWDRDLLRTEIEDLKLLDLDLSLTGFDELELIDPPSQPRDDKGRWTASKKPAAAAVPTSGESVNPEIFSGTEVTCPHCSAVFVVE